MGVEYTHIWLHVNRDLEGHWRNRFYWFPPERTRQLGDRARKEISLNNLW